MMWWLQSKHVHLIRTAHVKGDKGKQRGQRELHSQGLSTTLLPSVRSGLSSWPRTSDLCGPKGLTEKVWRFLRLAAEQRLNVGVVCPSGMSVLGSSSSLQILPHCSQFRCCPLGWITLGRKLAQRPVVAALRRQHRPVHRRVRLTGS